MINFVEHGLSRLAFQFNNSEKLKSLISVQLDEYQVLNDTLYDLLNNRLIDGSVGVQLDKLGDILGIERKNYSDELYKKLLKATANVNGSFMTVENTLTMISMMFNGVKVKYSLTASLQPHYTIMKILNQEERRLLDELPTLLGIGDINYVSAHDINAFGFSDDPDARGFSSINDSELGGNFASII